MTTLFLIRHGLTAQTGKRLYGRTPGVGLDERGRAQANTLVDRFAGIGLAAIYSSPLDRCVQTAAPLAADRRLDVIPSDGLIEMEAGAWTMRPLAQLGRTKLWRQLLETPSQFRFPGGEGFAAAQARAVDEVSRIAAAHGRRAVALFTHGDIVRMLVAHFTGAHLDHFQRVLSDPASVSVVHLARGAPHIVLVNDTDGLGRFSAPRGKANLQG